MLWHRECPGKLLIFSLSAFFGRGALSPLFEDGYRKEVNFHFQSKGKGKRGRKSTVAVSLHLKCLWKGSKVPCAPTGEI